MVERVEQVVLVADGQFQRGGAYLRGVEGAVLDVQQIQQDGQAIPLTDDLRVHLVKCDSPWVET